MDRSMESCKTTIDLLNPSWWTHVARENELTYHKPVTRTKLKQDWPTHHPRTTPEP